MKPSLTIAQVAKRLGLSRGRIDQLMRQGDLVFKVDKLTGWRLVSEREVARLERERNK